MLFPYTVFTYVWKEGPLFLLALFYLFIEARSLSVLGLHDSADWSERPRNPSIPTIGIVSVYPELNLFLNVDARNQTQVHTASTLPAEPLPRLKRTVLLFV